MGCIDKAGNEMIPIKYDEIELGFDSEGFARVTLIGKKGYIE